MPAIQYCCCQKNGNWNCTEVKKIGKVCLVEKWNVISVLPSHLEPVIFSFTLIIMWFQLHTVNLPQVLVNVDLMVNKLSLMI